MAIVNTVSALFGFLYLILVMGLLAYGVALASRFVRAHERSANAMDRLSRSVEQIAQSGIPTPEQPR